jgi:hypothetical protein
MLFSQVNPAEAAGKVAYSAASIKKEFGIT